MKIYGHEVKQEWIDACVAATKGEFTARDVQLAAMSVGCPESMRTDHRNGVEWFAYRVADRVLKNAKRSGAIIYNKSTRKWTRL